MQVLLPDLGHPGTTDSTTISGSWLTWKLTDRAMKHIWFAR
jgi:hypothetical protein